MKQNNKDYQLTAVDYDILQLVQQYFYLTAEQIVRLRYSKNSLPTAQLRLLALTQAGFLLRTRLPKLSPGNSHFVYHLSTKAQRVLSEESGSDVVSRIRPDDISNLQYPFLSHCLAIDDFLINASLLNRTISAISIDWLHDLELKKTPLKFSGEKRLPNGRNISQQWAIVPDAFIEAHLTLPDRARSKNRAICLELDRGTIATSRFRDKVLAYYWCAVSPAYQAMFNTSNCLVAFATTAGEKRLEQMIAWAEQELTEQGLEHENSLYLFTSLPDEYTPREIFCSNSWRRPFENDELFPLLWNV